MTRKPTPNHGRFDFDRFVERVCNLENLDKTKLSEALDSEIATVEAKMRGRGGPQARADGGVGYVSRIRKLRFNLENPGTLLQTNDGETAACHKIGVKLVENGQLEPDALNVFSKMQDRNG